MIGEDGLFNLLYETLESLDGCCLDSHEDRKKVVYALVEALGVVLPETSQERGACLASGTGGFHSDGYAEGEPCKWCGHRVAERQGIDMKPMTWRFILNTEHAQYDHIDTALETAMHVGYPYFVWNGRVLNTLEPKYENSPTLESLELERE